MMHCKHEDCIYQGQLGENMNYCNYIGHTGKSRRCDPECCDKYIAKMKEDKNDCKDLSGSAE